MDALAAARARTIAELVECELAADVIVVELVEFELATDAIAIEVVEPELAAGAIARAEQQQRRPAPSLATKQPAVT